MAEDVNVNVKIADAGPAGWLAYSIATWMAWAFLVGYVQPSALLFMAALSLACAIPYLIAGITQLKLGNVAGGVTWTYFGSFFAFASGLNYAITYFAPIYKWELDARILGYEWAILGIVLILTTPIFAKYSPAAATISVIGADVGIACLALVDRKSTRLNSSHT
jgi:succinate-acetate transporter protein